MLNSSTRHVGGGEREDFLKNSFLFLIKINAVLRLLIVRVTDTFPNLDRFFFVRKMKYFINCNGPWMGARRAKRRRIASDPKPSFGSIIQFQHELKTCRFRTHNRPLFPINNLAASIHPSWGRVQRSWRRISRLWPFQKEKRQMKNVESTPMGRRRGPLHFCKSFANFSVDGLPFSVGSWLAIIRSSCCKKNATGVSITNSSRFSKWSTGHQRTQIHNCVIYFIRFLALV